MGFFALYANFASNSMVMFAIHSVYLKSPDIVDEHVGAHRAFLKTLYEKGITIF